MSHFSLRGQIFFSMLFVSCMALFSLLYYTASILHNAMVEDRQTEIVENAHVIARLLPQKSVAELHVLANSLAVTKERLTIIDTDGTVLVDSNFANESTLDKHNDRPEVLAAQKDGQGVFIRHSLSLDTDLLYGAVQSDDGRIVRLSMPFVGIKTTMEEKKSVLFAVAAALFAMTCLLSYFVSRNVKNHVERMVGAVQNIAEGQYEKRLRVVPGKEFVPLADAVNRLAENIAEHIATVQGQAVLLESILNAMDDGVVVLDGKSNICKYNNAIEKIFPQIARVGQVNIIEAIPAPAVQEAVENIVRAQQQLDWQSAEQGAAASYGKTVQCTVQGKSYSVSLSVPQHPTENFSAVAVFRDISELMRLERVRQEFVANASHELRTPLTAIQSYAETLAELDAQANTTTTTQLGTSSEFGQENAHNASALRQKFCAVIVKNANYLRKLINDLLALTRLEQAENVLELHALNPARSVADACTLCDGVLNNRHIILQNTVPENITVFGSETHLTEVFCNLLENACRYSEDGGTICLGVQEHDDTQFDTFTTFYVSDTGKGIPKASLPHIFERFYRVEKHRGQSGTGLGLAICKHIVESHGGTIWAESPAQGASTVFYFTLLNAKDQTQAENER